jgi:hypothetical protein
VGVGERKARREPDVSQPPDIGLYAPATPAEPVGDKDSEVDPFGQPIIRREDEAVLERPASLGVRQRLGAAVGRVQVLAQRSESDRQRPRVKVTLLHEAPDRELGEPSGSADGGARRRRGDIQRREEECQVT